MSRSAEVTLVFGDAERTFRLGIGELRQVQEKCDAGPEEIAARLLPSVHGVEKQLALPIALAHGLVGRYRIDDVREPIYRGLIGGGMPPSEAGPLVMDLVDGRPLRENVTLAYAIIVVALQGAPDEPLGEPEGGATKAAKRSPARKSASATSTPPAGASD